jgi:hypothetical protein
VENIDTGSYKKLREKGLCVKCAQPALPSRSMCDNCGIKAIWSTNRTASSSKGYVPISAKAEDFVAWYKHKRESSAGVCEWCDELFGIAGPIVSFNRQTGNLRALVCILCNKAEGLGIERLKIALKALEEKPSKPQKTVNRKASV